MSDAVSVEGLPDSANVEAVILRISVEHADAWDLDVTVTSPAGTRSVVNAPFNAAHDEFRGLRDWELMSNAFYGENPNGEWRVRVLDLHAGDTGELSSWGLRFHYGEHPRARTCVSLAPLEFAPARDYIRNTGQPRFSRCLNNCTLPRSISPTMPGSK